MKNIIIESSLVPQGIVINLFGTFWCKDKRIVDKMVINHERIHTAQMLELLVIPFYIWYVIEWGIKLIKYPSGKDAYYNISFEREAYQHGNDLTYLPRRRYYNFLKFISKKH